MESLLLSAKLQEFYSSTSGDDELNIYCPVIEQACVARYEDKWYRAQVIGEVVCGFFSSHFTVLIEVKKTSLICDILCV